MLVSIVIPAHNASATITQCLEGCLAQTYEPLEIIIVDDGSTDDTKEIVRQFDVALIEADHGGPAAARNRGAKEAHGEIVVFTDSDCVPERGWIEKLVSGFEEDVAGVGGSYAIANSQSKLAVLVHKEIMMRHERIKPDADFLGSFNVAYRREVFLEAGGFDENFKHASGEDNDLAYRLHDAGWRLRFMPEARVAHYHPSNVWRYLRTQFRHGFWRMKLYRKHRGRAGGDQYAGLIDLVGPPWVLVTIFMMILTTAWEYTDLPYFNFLNNLTFAVMISYFASRLFMPFRMLGRLDDVEYVEFFFLAVARDIARGLGMVWGIVWFMVLGRATI